MSKTERVDRHLKTSISFRFSNRTLNLIASIARKLHLTKASAVEAAVTEYAQKVKVGAGR